MKNKLRYLLLIFVFTFGFVTLASCDSNTANDSYIDDIDPEDDPDLDDPEAPDIPFEPVLPDDIEEPLEEISGVRFKNKTVTYNGSSFTIEIEGELPEGVSVTYENNTATNAGAYSCKATLKGKGYENLVLDATLTIKKANFNTASIKFVSETVKYDGKLHKIVVSGLLPEETDILYTKNSGTNIDVYEAQALLLNVNYEPLILYATLEITA